MRRLSRTLPLLLALSLLAGCAGALRPPATSIGTATAAAPRTTSGAVGAPGTPVASAATPTSGIPAFDHIYWLVLENKEQGQVLGSPEAPYLNGLAARYGLALRWDAVAHPSQPNYLALFSGSTQSVSNDGHYDLAGRNLADQLEADGRSWRVFAQNVPPGCYRGDTASGGEDGPGTYARKHEPAISFIDVSGDPARCADITDFSHFDPAAADFALIVPNLCDDMHDCSLGAGDRWLQSWLPAHLLDTPAWQESDSLLVITFDEGTSNEGGGGRVATIVVSKHTPAGFRSELPHTHYSLLRTVEDAWGLGCLNASCDANNLGEFFRP